MGKRELLLIAAFVVVGAIVYQFTAPPPAPGERSFVPGQVLDHIRRAMRGNRASAELTTKSSYPVESSVSELRFADLKSTNVTITGEDRSDIDAELRVHSNAFDDEEAERTAKESVLKLDRAGERMVFTVSYPEAGMQRGWITMKVPKRLAVQLQGGGNTLAINHIAGIELGGARGKVDIGDIAGLVSGAHRGGDLHVVDAGAVKLTVSGTDVEIERIRGAMSLTMRGGDLKCHELGGSIDLDTSGTDITIDRLEKSSGIVRINAVGGSLEVKGLRTEGRFDVRGADVDVTIDRAAPLAIYSEGGDPIEITPPSGGYQLDAVANDGTIDLPEETLEITTTGSERRATGPINGGGPTITVRSRRGNITVRQRN
jgi:putative adhesin